MKEFTRGTFVRKFFKDNNLPFPVAEEWILPYYSTIAGYEDLVGRWTDYITLVESAGYNNYIDTKDKLEATVHREITETAKYKELLSDKIEVGQLRTNVKRDLYKEDLVDKVYLSIDLKNANFYALYKYGVVEDSTWSTWLSKFTKEESLLSSKALRQIVLGKLNNKRITNIEKNIMIDIAESLVDVLPLNDLIVFNKDELVYMVGDESQLTLFPHLAESLPHCTVEQFTLRKTKFGFAKVYLDGKVSFHAVPKKYWLENYKDFYNLPLIREDFLFLDEDRNLCERLRRTP